MEFEEALVEELSTIIELNGKIFPLRAEDGETPPFLVYISSEGQNTQVLNAYLDTKEIHCEIHILTSSYYELKTITRKVIERLKSFYGRAIGTNGPIIKSFSYDEPTEVFEHEVNFRRSSFDFRVRI